jgi:hypothetical protein
MTEVLDTIVGEFQKYYSPLVKQAYQKGSLLDGTVRDDGAIIGNECHFRRSGKTIAKETSRGSDIVYSSTGLTHAIAKIKNIYNAELVLEEDMAKINFSYISIIANNNAMSIGRKQDQLIIDDALAKTSTPALAGTDKDTIFNIELLVALNEYFDNNAVPMGERYILLNAPQKTTLFSDEKYIKWNFNGQQAPLKDGLIQDFLGNKFIVFEKREEGGLPLEADGALRCFAFDRRAVGKVKNSGELNNQIDRIASKMGVQILSTAASGATNIDDKGILPFLVKAIN